MTLVIILKQQAIPGIWIQKNKNKIYIIKIDNEQYNTLMGYLNDGQRQVLYHTTHILRSQICGNTVPAFLAYIIGPAGAGKPMLIKALAQSVIRRANLKQI